MPSRPWVIRPRVLVTPIFAAALVVGLGGSGPRAYDPPSSAKDLARLTPLQLDHVFSTGRALPLPSGPVRGMALVQPGSRFGGPASRGSRVVWQGKIIENDSDEAVNRFFGLPVVRSTLRFEPSWYDSEPCLVLDYTQTSRVYRNVRDEVREVGPGLYLGRMYDIHPSPKFRRYFALECSR